MKLVERMPWSHLPRSSFCRILRPQNSGIGASMQIVVAKQELQYQAFPLQSSYHSRASRQQMEVENALSCLFELDVAPSHDVYTSLLKLCQERNSVIYVHYVLVHLVIHQWDLVHSFGDSIVFTLAKCGGLEDALYLIKTLPCHTVFAWTSVIASCVQSNQGLEALRMHSCMLLDGVEPDRYTFVSLLKACGSINDVAEGKKLHMYVQEKGLTPDLYVASTLMSMYGKCGNTMEAEWVFSGLSKRNSVTWNAMLSAYVGQSEGRKALLLYRQMLELGESPSELTFLSVLQACSILSRMEEHSTSEVPATGMATFEICQALHADARKNNVDSQVNLGNTLVNVYGKYGLLCEAEHAFLCISRRDVVSWNTMLSAYVDQDQGVKVLQAYIQMQSEDTSPDEHTFAIILQACCILAANEEAVLADTEETRAKSLKIGQFLHADVERMGFYADSFVVSTLVGLYGKCGLIREAEYLFLRSCEHDVVSWTSMLSALVEQGYGDKALQAYRQMQEGGIKADEGTLIALLQACGAVTDVGASIDRQLDSEANVYKDVCRAVHAEAQRKHILRMSFFNTLITMYGKCDMIAEAEHLFSGLEQRNVISWNALLSVYVEHDEAEKALLLYKVLLQHNIFPDELTYLMLLQACSIFGEKKGAIAEGGSIKNIAFNIGQALHTDAQKSGFVSNTFIRNALINMYSKCGGLSEALKVFTSVSQQGIVAWNALISAFLLQGRGNEVLHLYREMQTRHMSVNKATLVRALQACSELSNLEMCRELHFGIAAVGYEWNSSVANTLIHTYGGCAFRDDALSVFCGLREPQVVSWNACLTSNTYDRNSLHDLEEVLLSGIYPNEVTFLSMLSACSHSGQVFEGVYLFICMRNFFNINAEMNHYAVMVDLFGRAGDFERVECFMEKIAMGTELSVWSRLLGACRTHGNVDLGKWAFEQAVSLCPGIATSYVWMSNIYAAAAVEESVRFAEDLSERDHARDVDSSILVNASSNGCTSMVKTPIYSPESCKYSLHFKWMKATTEICSLAHDFSH